MGVHRERRAKARLPVSSDRRHGAAHRPQSPAHPFPLEALPRLSSFLYAKTSGWQLLPTTVPRNGPRAAHAADHVVRTPWPLDYHSITDAPVRGVRSGA